MQVQKPRNGYKLVKSLFGKYEETPEDWIVSSIKDLGNIVTGNTPDTSVQEYYGNDVLWASPTDLGFTKYVNTTKNKLSLKGYKISRQIPSKSILVVCIGSTIGKIGIATQNMSSNQQINSIICKEDDNEYVYYQILFNSQKIQNMANNVAVPILNKNDFGTIKIYKPKNIQEQQKIASILSNIDSLISQTQKEIEHTQRLKKGLMQKLLTRGIGHTKFKKIKTLYGKYEEIPEDWEYRKLSDLAKVKGGKRLPKGEPFSLIKTEHPYLRVTDFRNYGINESNLKYISSKIFQKIKNYTISSDDVYISIAGTIGLAGLIPESLDGANLTENAAKITNLQEIKKEYLSILLNSELIQNQIKSYLGKTSQPKLALFRIEKLELPLPAIQEQQKIASILSNVDSQIQKQQEHKSKLESLKKGLMQKLLTGQIRVKV